MTTLKEFADSCEWSFEFVPQNGLDGKAVHWQVKWNITVKRNGHTLTSPYSYGIGYLPVKCDFFGRMTADEYNATKRIAETGTTYHGGKHHTAPQPDPVNVLACLASDSDAVDYPTFEEWAHCLGLDADSREAERIYRACLETGLNLRRLFGEDFDALREAATDW